MKLADLDVNQLYTYADYLKWQFTERVELIKGKIFEMAAPNTKHEAVNGLLYRLISDFLEDKPIYVFIAPVDVILSIKTKDDTVLQPDVGVVCDPSKIQPRGCIGAPDIVVEVLSPSNTRTDIDYKFRIYEEAGVSEYWIISPQDKTFLVNSLIDGHYVTQNPMTSGYTVTTPILPGFSINLEDYFNRAFKKFKNFDY